ncbi:MAG: DUF86 domain-containing protein [Bacteroidales bacterium]|nr:DUF86 domain-containing protein [Bacteroidales bacterium]
MREPVRDKGRLEHIIQAIEKMRHILVHDYYQINKNVLWQVITEDLPALKIQVNDYLKEM